MGGSASSPADMDDEEEGAVGDAAAATSPETDASSSTTGVVAVLRQEDISEDIIDTEQNVGEKKYRITLLCERNNTRLGADDVVNYSILGTNRSRLVVTVGDRIYHKARLPGSVDGCKVEKKRGREDDLIIITLDKSEPKIWKKA